MENNINLRVNQFFNHHLTIFWPHVVDVISASVWWKLRDWSVQHSNYNTAQYSLIMIIPEKQISIREAILPFCFSKRNLKFRCTHTFFMNVCEKLNYINYNNLYYYRKNNSIELHDNICKTAVRLRKRFHKLETQTTSWALQLLRRHFEKQKQNTRYFYHLQYTMKK